MQITERQIESILHFVSDFNLKSNVENSNVQRNFILKLFFYTVLFNFLPL